MKNSLLLHPNDSHIIYPLGATVVIRNVHDNKDQFFLQGAPPGAFAAAHAAARPPPAPRAAPCVPPAEEPSSWPPRTGAADASPAARRTPAPPRQATRIA